MSWPVDAVRRIVCAVDGSVTSLQAAESALGLAARTGADLVFVHVCEEKIVDEVVGAIGGDRDEARRRLHESHRHVLGRVCEIAEKREVPCASRLEHGDPPGVIDQVAREVDADLIIVGKSGHRGVTEYLVGSVTRRLIESTRVPVVVITGRPETGPEPGAGPRPRGPGRPAHR